MPKGFTDWRAAAAATLLRANAVFKRAGAAFAQVTVAATAILGILMLLPGGAQATRPVCIPYPPRFAAYRHPTVPAI